MTHPVRTGPKPLHMSYTPNSSETKSHSAMKFQFFIPVAVMAESVSMERLQPLASASDHTHTRTNTHTHANTDTQTHTTRTPHAQHRHTDTQTHRHTDTHTHTHLHTLSPSNMLSSLWCKPDCECFQCFSSCMCVCVCVCVCVCA